MAKEKTKKRLILLDTHAILHRAYHALPDFASRTGEPTGALYGLTAMLMKIIQELKPDYIVAAFDLPKPTHRHEVFDGYKAGRKETDNELVQQITRSRDVLEVFGIPIYEKEGYEADDVLGTIASGLKKNADVEVLIATGDMDTLQLVDKKRVQVYTLRKGIKDTVIYDEKAVHERFGFGPDLVADYKGLRGDPSDNIPGIRGIGEKTATDLILSFGSIENIYKALKKNPEKFEQKGIKPRIKKLLEEGEEEALFSKMLATIQLDVPIDFSLPQKTWKEALQSDNVLDLFSQLGFRTLSQRFKQQFDIGAAESKAESGDEQTLFKTEDIDEEEIHETGLALWILNSDITNPTLDDILEFSRTREFAKAKKHIFSELQKQNLLDVFETIEKPLVPIVATMTKDGVKLDTKYLATLSGDYHTKLSKLQKKIYKHAGEEFNINSPKQLADILYEKLGLTGGKKTATGQRSTKESELHKLIDKHPIITEVLEHRELQKLLSTYIDALPHMVSKDGRLHTTFLQTGTATGRMASQNPNVQNIPVKTDLGRKVRNAFVAEKGHVLVALDYSQIELRIAAALSEDEELMRTFKEGGDVHAAVAAHMFDVSIDDVTPEMRRTAKVINFGIIYGMGVNALAKTAEITRAEAQKYLKEYTESLTGLTHYIQTTKGIVRKKGYAETMFGRRRYLPGITSRVPYIRAEAERMAVNAPIQGTQADIIKLAMIQIDAWLNKKKLNKKAKMILQIHDELIFEVAKDSVDVVVPEIRKIMEDVFPKKQAKGVPIKVDVKVGTNWGEMKELKNN